MTLADIDLDSQQHFVFDDVSWDFYEHLLDEISDRPIRVTYDNGRLEMMSPLPKHGSWGARIGRLIEMLTYIKKIPVVSGGVTTFKDKAKKIGLEPDECYFFASSAKAFAQIEGEWDPTIHPAPDLVVEVDITRKSINKLPLYAQLGVKEVWRFDGKKLNVHVLDSSDNYAASRSSSIFPFLPMEQFEAFLLRFRTEWNETAVVEAFEDWARRL